MVTRSDMLIEISHSKGGIGGNLELKASRTQGVGVLALPKHQLGRGFQPRGGRELEPFPSLSLLEGRGKENVGFNSTRSNRETPEDTLESENLGLHWLLSITSWKEVGERGPAYSWVYGFWGGH